MRRGLLVGGVASGCGKTTVTLGLMAALRRRGLAVQGFKVGPDYIDPGLHSQVTGRPSWNLDGWMCGRDLVRRTFFRAMTGDEGRTADIGIVEGVMGLFDGASGAEDNGSSAEIAVWLDLPVVLVVDARGMARSVAAVVRGHAGLRPDLRLAGVICTRVGSANHESLIREALAASCPGITLLGCLPVNEAVSRAARHLGLVTAEDEPLAGRQQEALADWCSAHVDLQALLRLSVLPDQREASASVPMASFQARPRVAVARDRAFCFIYPALLAALREAGADVVFFSPLTDTALPPCDGLWIPGGYPELHAPALAANHALLQAVRETAAVGLPIHGECGGYMWLMEALETESGRHEMIGCLPGTVRIGARRAALGYRGVCAHTDTALGQQGIRARGHEFHYGYIAEGAAALSGTDCAPLWRVTDRQGRDLGVEGCRCGSVTGSWVHVHPDSNPAMIASFVEACRTYGRTPK